jgi:putative chitinase
MTLISPEQLKECFPSATANLLSTFLEPLNETCERYEINTPHRLACFMAQIAHESGCLRYTLELGKGEAYDVGKLAENLGNTPEDDGDGERYKGRGLIQITGTTNYKALSDELKVDFLANPELLQGPLFASLSAGWFWKWKQLNSVADQADNWRRDYKGKLWTRFEWISIKINGFNSKIGEPNGLADRLKYYAISKKVFNA